MPSRPSLLTVLQREHQPDTSSNGTEHQFTIDAAWLVLACHLLELRAAEVIDDQAAASVALALQSGTGASVPLSGAREELNDLLRQVESRVPSAVGGVLTLGLSAEETLATSGRMIWRHTMLDFLDTAAVLSASVLRLAQTHVVTTMPAYLGGQPGQPTTLAHFLGGVLEPLNHARERVRISVQALNQSPLGSGLLAGDVVGADREEAATRLGFGRPLPSTIDALGETSSPTAAVEAMTAVFAGMARLVRELRIWVRTDPTSFVMDETWSVSPEAGHPALALSYRLDALNLALDAMLDRLDAARLALRRLDFGPAGIGHDVIIGQAIDLAPTAQAVLHECIDLFETGIIVNRAYLGNRAGRFYTTAPDLAAFLMTQENLPPAMARQIAILVLARIKDMRLEVSGITPDMIDSAALMTIGRELKVEMETLGRFLAPRRYIERRQVTGSPAPDMTRAWLEACGQKLDDDRAWLADQRATINDALNSLRHAISELAEHSGDN